MSIFSKIKKALLNNLGPGSTAYGILKACRRCVYQKSHEPILLVSKDRGPRIIIIPGSGCYVRQGSCIGYDKCGKCFEQVEKQTLNCQWKKF